jgi:hypothetical protein
MKAMKVLLLAMVLAMFSASVRADGVVDPTIKLGPSGASTHTMAGESAQDPLFVTDASGTSDWFLDNPLIAENGVVYIEVIPFSGESLSQFLNESWTCQPVPPISTGCGFLPTLQGLLSNAVAQGFSPLSCTSYNQSGQQVTVACPAVEVDFTGPFTVGEDVSIDVPEPSALLLLGSGLLLLLGFAMTKRRLDLAF